MRYILIVVFCLSGMISPAQKDGFKKVADPREIELKLVKASASVNTITSDFVQEKHLDYLSVVIESKGKFWFKKPGILRWEYTEPYKYLIVINQGKIIIKDEDKKNEFDVNSNKAFQELNNIIVNSVNGTLIESDKYDYEILEGRESWLVRLYPKNEQIKKVMSNIELYFLKTDLSVNKIKMVESDQDFTIITLRNKKFNDPIPASVFKVN
ncbi:MAG: outer membrane lipoprotein carrier protein LolA [Bacteroidota bacterium]